LSPQGRGCRLLLRGLGPARRPGRLPFGGSSAAGPQR
jgi:hypothetical protein